jgi:hypothetical protein
MVLAVYRDGLLTICPSRLALPRVRGDAPGELADRVERGHSRGNVKATQGGFGLGALRVGRERLAVALAVGFARAVGLAVSLAHAFNTTVARKKARAMLAAFMILPICVGDDCPARNGGVFLWARRLDYRDARRVGKGPLKRAEKPPHKPQPTTPEPC